MTLADESIKAAAVSRAGDGRSMRPGQAFWFALGAGLFVLSLGGGLAYCLGVLHRLPQLSPGDHLLIQQLLNQQRDAEAARQLEHLVALKPRDYVSWYYLALARGRLRDPAGQASAYEGALAAVGPRGPPDLLASFHDGLGVALRDLGRPQAASEHFAQACRLVAGDDTPWQRHLRESTDASPPPGSELTQDAPPAGDTSAGTRE